MIKNIRNGSSNFLDTMGDTWKSCFSKDFLVNSAMVSLWFQQMLFSIASFSLMKESVLDEIFINQLTNDNKLAGKNIIKCHYSPNNSWTN